MNGGLRGKLRGQHPPLATGFEQITDGVVAGTHRFGRSDPSGLARGSGRKEKGFQKGPFLIADIGRVAFFHALRWHIMGIM